MEEKKNNAVEKAEKVAENNQNKQKGKSTSKKSTAKKSTMNKKQKTAAAKKRLKEQKRQQKLVQRKEKLAEKAGISRSLVSTIEAPGIANGFSLEVFFDIADALEIDPADLINASVFPDRIATNRR